MANLPPNHSSTLLPVTRQYGPQTVTRPNSNSTGMQYSTQTNPIYRYDCGVDGCNFISNTHADALLHLTLHRNSKTQINANNYYPSGQQRRDGELSASDPRFVAPTSQTNGRAPMSSESYARGVPHHAMSQSWQVAPVPAFGHASGTPAFSSQEDKHRQHSNMIVDNPTGGPAQPPHMVTTGSVNFNSMGDSHGASRAPVPGHRLPSYQTTIQDHQAIGPKSSLLELGTANQRGQHSDDMVVDSPINGSAGPVSATAIRPPNPNVFDPTYDYLAGPGLLPGCDVGFGHPEWIVPKSSPAELGALKMDYSSYDEWLRRARGLVYIQNDPYVSSSKASSSKDRRV
ncbi:unnamed protein product [Somion occarium]|uniref:C2H2-type domain-containing protein n=1 Tax=Somion occarium TaxID=3059160 RepID=A0ABP1DPW9_9APHY